MNATDELFYDGGCGLCHRVVAFVLNRGRKGEVFRFAPLGGETFQRLAARGNRAGWPDSLVVIAASGAVLTRSRAVLHILLALGGGWGLLGRLGRLLPLWLGDALYDSLARNRHRFFAKPAETCPRASAAQQARFDP